MQPRQSARAAPNRESFHAAQGMVTDVSHAPLITGQTEDFNLIASLRLECGPVQ